jgi:hypothetical protein
MVADQCPGVGLPALRPVGDVGALAAFVAYPSFRFERPDRRLEFVHGLRCVPHALEVRVEFGDGTRVANDDQVIVHPRTGASHLPD